MGDGWEAKLQRMPFEPERRVAIGAVRALLKRYPDAVVEDVEYPVVGRFDQLGRGDVRLVAGDTVVVLETKFLDFAASGRTARVRRTQHRKKLVEQCVVYCAWTRLQTAFVGKRVVGFVATNERGDGALRMVVASMSLAEAVRHAVDALENAGQPHVWSGVADRLKALRPRSEEGFG